MRILVVNPFGDTESHAQDNLAAISDPSVLSTLLTGQVLALFIIVVAAAEIALGLGIVIALYRSRDTVDVSQANLMSK